MESEKKNLPSSLMDHTSMIFFGGMNKNEDARARRGSEVICTAMQHPCHVALNPRISPMPYLPVTSQQSYTRLHPHGLHNMLGVGAAAG